MDHCFFPDAFHMFVYCVLPPDMSDVQLKRYIGEGVDKGTDKGVDKGRVDALFTLIRNCIGIDMSSCIHGSPEDYAVILQIIAHRIHAQPHVVSLLFPTYREDLIQSFRGEEKAKVKRLTSCFFDVIENLYRTPRNTRFSCVFEEGVLRFAPVPEN